jgi:hypothetical protein
MVFEIRTIDRCSGYSSNDSVITKQDPIKAIQSYLTTLSLFCKQQIANLTSKTILTKFQANKYWT